MTSVPISADSGSGVVLELIYRLKVKDVMTRSPITAAPNEAIRSAQAKMKDREITGLPVVDRGALVGVISIGDIIDSLESGRIDEPVQAAMSPSPIVLEDDMPLSFAITYLNRYGYGRFPVLDKSRALVGIVTASDIVRRLLVEMNREVERLESSLPQGAAAKPGVERMSFRTVRLDFENAGRASKEIKARLRARGVGPEPARRVAIACYELELNQVIHSLGGTIEATIGDGLVEIVASDDGPGIADTAKAMAEGYSTANEWVRSLGFGAGMGLPNARKVSDGFAIDSEEGKGTSVRVAIRYTRGETDHEG